jgi:hypothetical protein
MSNEDETDPRPTAPEENGPTGDDRVVAERVHADEPSPTTGPAPPRQPSLAGTIRQTIFKRPGSREQVPATEAIEANLSAVDATTVLMKQSGAEQITAERVTMEQSGARTIDAKSVQMDQSGVVALSSDNTVLMKSSAVQVVAEEARLSHSSAIFLSSGNATLENSRVAVFAGTANGDVHAVLTARSAAIAGGVFAVVLVLLLALLRSRSRG